MPEIASGLSADTEVLTPDGWKSGAKVRAGDDVAAFDPVKGVYGFERVLAAKARAYEGEMVHLKGPSGDFLLAPGHAVVLRTLPQSSRQTDQPNPWRYEQAAVLPRNFQLPLLGPLPVPGLLRLTNDFVQVLGWVIGSGYFHDKAESRFLGIQRSMRSSPRAGALIAAMDHGLGRMEGVRRYQRKTRDGVSYYLGKALSGKVLDVLGTDIHRIPRPLLKEGSPRQLSVLYQALIDTSGTTRGDEAVTFYPGGDEMLADDFQELATRLGITTTKTYVRAVRGWVVSLSHRRYYNVKQRRTGLRKASYQGQLWDLLVPSGAVLVRRVGRLVTMGACLSQPERLAALHADRRVRAAKTRKPRRRPAKAMASVAPTPALGMGTLKLRKPG